MTTQWTQLTAQEKQQAVRQLVSEAALTYTQAAQRLGTTRVAIAGVVNRSEPKIVSFRGPAMRTEPPREPRKITRLDAAWLPLPGTTPKPLAEHQYGECKWPIGEAPMLFCCAPALEEKPWCAAHDAMAYRATPPLKLNGKRKQ